MSTALKRSFATVAAGSLALAVVGCSMGGGGENGTATVRWAQPTPESMAYFPYIVADELGYFADEGVEVELAPTSEDLSTAALVSSGSVDIGAASAGEIFFALQTDPELTVVYDAASLSPEGIVVPADSSATSVVDLEGATIGIASDEERSLVAAALEAEGMSLDDVSLVTVGGGGQVIANELDGGQFDAFAGSVLDFAAVQAVGYELRQITPEAIATTPSGAYVISTDAEEDVIERFLRAMTRATAYGLENPDELESILRERVPEEWENEDVARALFEFGLEVWTPREGGQYGTLDPEVWQMAQDRLVAAGELDEEIDLDRLLDDQFIESANGAID
ncbi:ABC-type nitrate/sulfonate/bicarbonate transport system substrate-binding protein [Microbacterium sp. SLBN-154]|uniref:ABC transporter substrate-binding protein n=1 Tax=Microbacterium sp. SLBN-154 TaxID=2768458 RepID=UPI0011501DE8|nr:ABC transporter substrate-binding protein [Microbacterium sp. SLBN-154]TQK18815.1 ABC-type nitrate/sulfonate/bicarbonate transport system substrate-binding protein [Microbacterium sp. SLBN-154]